MLKALLITIAMSGTASQPNVDSSVEKFESMSACVDALPERKAALPDDVTGAVLLCTDPATGGTFRTDFK
jgi:hypothetical protein